MNRRRVDTVLRVRELQERLARQDVVRERAEMTARERAEQAAREQIEQHAGATSGTMTAARLLDRRHMLSSGVSCTDRLAASVADAARDVDTAMSSWQERAERLDGIERLAARVDEQAREEAARLEAATIDDLVVARWSGSDPTSLETAR